MRLVSLQLLMAVFLTTIEDAVSGVRDEVYHSCLSSPTRDPYMSLSLGSRSFGASCGQQRHNTISIHTQRARVPQSPRPYSALSLRKSESHFPRKRETGLRWPRLNLRRRYPDRRTFTPRARFHPGSSTFEAFRRRNQVARSWGH